MLNADVYAEVIDRHVELASDISWLISLLDNSDPPEDHRRQRRANNSPAVQIEGQIGARNSQTGSSSSRNLRKTSTEPHSSLPYESSRRMVGRPARWHRSPGTPTGCGPAVATPYESAHRHCGVNGLTRRSGGRPRQEATLDGLVREACRAVALL